MDDAKTPFTERDCFGRVVAKTKESLLSTPIRSQRNIVLVEFALGYLAFNCSEQHPTSKKLPLPMCEWVLSWNYFASWLRL
jgi:hypothetical protein